MSWAKPADAQQWQHEFGARLRRLRLERGLSQMQLAHKADLDPTYISAVEQGRRNLSLVNIHVLALVMEVDVRELFTSDDQPARQADGL